MLKIESLNFAEIKTEEWLEAKSLCDKVVDENPSVAKGYFRRGEALVALNEFELAKTDFVKVLELEPDNKAAKNKVAVCSHNLKLLKEREKRTFANMFDKVKHTSGYDRY